MGRGTLIRTLCLGLLLAAGTVAPAQESTTFKLVDRAFNAGGSSAPGRVLTSSSFRVTLSAIGDGIVRREAPASASFRTGAGFVARYAPPREVVGLRLADRRTLVWDPAGAAGIYAVHSGTLAALRAGSGLEGCLVDEVAGTRATDDFVPARGAGRLYLVTARNYRGESGTPGRDTAGVERSLTAACP